MTVRDWIESDATKKAHRQNIVQIAVNQARLAGAGFGRWASLKTCMDWIDNPNVIGWYGNTVERWRERLLAVLKVYQQNDCDMRKTRDYIGV